MNKLPVILLIFISTLFLLPRTETQAQAPACPAALVCVEWQGNLIHVDPTCGPTQVIVIGEDYNRYQSLAGVEEDSILEAIVISTTETGFEVVAQWEQPATGNLDGVRFGDVACLDWQESEELDRA